MKTEEEIMKLLSEKISPDVRKELICQLFETGIVITKQRTDGTTEILKAGSEEWFDALEKHKNDIQKQ